MAKTRRRPIETRRGTGRVFCDAVEVCLCSYLLTIEQEELAVDTRLGVQWLTGQKRITGVLWVTSENKDLRTGGDFCLHLQDGKARWNFVATGDPGTGVYECETASGGLIEG